MSRILVPLAVLEGESVSPGLVRLLEPADVTVLGYHVLPEQTPPDQARVQYGDRATATLETLTATFEAGGGAADYRLAFTHDRDRTIDRVAAETGSQAYVLTGIADSIDRLLVPLTGDVAADRVLAFVADLIDDREIGVTLFLATDAEADGRLLLEEAAETLSSRGIDTESTLVVSEGALGGRTFDALREDAAAHDAVVVGERAPSLQSLLFGDEAERLAAESVGPVLVVRRPDDSSAEGESGSGSESEPKP
ncbi:universal stress protein [Halopiger xanaduensis]|uniref:UspA domain-containing protein n=1 Tax=Halopiger xanaduensis (strain DSM 18323 / JCM 14033 / SH-6) TaxID=797210 RepID=F8DB88_HALXS|nr:universal stress protein [Halopiger xanaduensis]AEH35864.1 UspA domain-containing protein [Halopiger xanaduensis SH-6]